MGLSVPNCELSAGRSKYKESSLVDWIHQRLTVHQLQLTRIRELLAATACQVSYSS